MLSNLFKLLQECTRILFTRFIFPLPSRILGYHKTSLQDLKLDSLETSTLFDQVGHISIFTDKYEELFHFFTHVFELPIVFEMQDFPTNKSSSNNTARKSGVVTITAGNVHIEICSVERSTSTFLNWLFFNSWKASIGGESLTHHVMIGLKKNHDLTLKQCCSLLQNRKVPLSTLVFNSITSTIEHVDFPGTPAYLPFRFKSVYFKKNINNSFLYSSKPAPVTHSDFPHRAIGTDELFICDFHPEIDFQFSDKQVEMRLKNKIAPLGGYKTASIGDDLKNRSYKQGGALGILYCVCINLLVSKERLAFYVKILGKPGLIRANTYVWAFKKNTPYIRLKLPEEQSQDSPNLQEEQQEQEQQPNRGNTQTEITDTVECIQFKVSSLEKVKQVLDMHQVSFTNPDGKKIVIDVNKTAGVRIELLK